MPITVRDIQLDGHGSCFYVDGMSNPRELSREALLRKSRDTELDDGSFRHTGHILFGHRNQQPQTGSLFHPHDGNSHARTAGWPHKCSRVNVSLRHHTVEWRSHLQIPFNLADGFQCGSRRLSTFADGFNPCTVCLDCPLRDLQIISGDNAGSRGSRLQSLVGAFVRGQLGFCLSTLASDERDRKSTRLNSSHSQISYAVFCLKKKKKNKIDIILKKRRH